MTFDVAMTWLNAAASSVLVVGLILIAVGYRQSLRRVEQSPEWYFSMGKVLLALAFGIRLLWWDVIWASLHVFDRDKAQALADAIGGVQSNILSISIGLASVYCSLKARQLLIREEEQKDWPWIVAWAHPSFWGLPRRRDD